MIDLKFLGRGGYGIVTTARILGKVAIESGYHATAVPRYGAERRGAPVHADVRISKNKIKLKSFITKGDISILLTPEAFSFVEIENFTKSEGLAIINDSPPDDQINESKDRRVIFFPATKLALKQFQTSNASIILLGYVCKVLGFTNSELLSNTIYKELSFLSKPDIDKMVEIGIDESSKSEIDTFFVDGGSN